MSDSECTETNRQCSLKGQRRDSSDVRERQTSRVCQGRVSEKWVYVREVAVLLWGSENLEWEIVALETAHKFILHGLSVDFATPHPFFLSLHTVNSEGCTDLLVKHTVAFTYQFCSICIIIIIIIIIIIMC
jgi:hypothetical protein